MNIRTMRYMFLFVLMTAVCFAQGDTSETFEVKGLCSLCKNRIEKAAQSVDGVSKADWNIETKMLNVTFDSKKTTIHNIHKAIADVGHDTPMHKAKDEVYDKLPGCCKYDRTESKNSKP